MATKAATSVNQAAQTLVQGLMAWVDLAITIAARYGRRLVQLHQPTISYGATLNAGLSWFCMGLPERSL